ncbi:MAG: hypothetical protein ACLP9C_07465 [Acidimicrobiales bacterium]
MTTTGAGSGAARAGPARAPARLRRWLGTADGRAVSVLVVVPLVLFVVPALFGYPAIAGDNTIQNFPLRALTGEVVRQGHLPLWNPFIWSGSPLLGGLNAGAAYPFTAAFVVLPPVAAFVVNLLATYWAAGLGLYLLLRQFALRPLACLLASLTFAFAGAMSGQIVHLGMVQGYGWLPLMVLAQFRLSWALFGTGPPAPRPRPDRLGEAPGVAGTGRRPSVWASTVLLGVVLGFILLTGEPRAMAEAEIVSALVTLWLVLRPYAGVAVSWGSRVAYLCYSLLAAVWGLALGAVQLLPGWQFISTSQRSSENYTFFASGSFHPQWSVLMLVPDLFGGDGILHQPTYFNSYNLPEVVGYVGLLPLAAALALLTRSFGRNRDPRSADWAPWLALAVVGTLLTFGSYTWFGGLFGHIPFFNKVRLQSRNLVLVDLSLAVLLGFWADRLLAGRAEGAGVSGWRRWVTAAPPLAAVVLCLVAIATPTRLETALSFQGILVDVGRRLTPWFAVELVVAVAAAGLVLGWPAIPHRWRAGSLAAVVVADLVLFTASTSVGLTAGHATLEPTTAQAVAVLGARGRFAIYDTTALNIDDLSVVGQPDLNAFTKLPSVQGYGSIVSNDYGDATGSHDLDTLDPCAMARGVFGPLRLASFLTLPEFVAPGLGPAGGIPAPPAACPGAPPPGTAGRRILYLGWAPTLVSAEVRVRPGTPAAALAARIRVGILTADGATRWPADSVVRTSDGWSVRFARPLSAAGLVVAGPARVVSDTSSVRAPGGAGWAFDGPLQDALGTAGWSYTGNWRQFSQFRHPSVPPPVWVVGSALDGTVRRLQVTDWGTETDRVRAHRPVLVVRSEAYAAGWRVEATPVGGGPSRTLAVVPVGLVQGVTVPAGSWDLTFLYRPRGLTLGLVGSSAGLAALVAAGVVALGRRRARARAGSIREEGR